MLDSPLRGAVARGERLNDADEMIQLRSQFSVRYITKSYIMLSGGYSLRQSRDAWVLRRMEEGGEREIARYTTMAKVIEALKAYKQDISAHNPHARKTLIR